MVNDVIRPGLLHHVLLGEKVPNKRYRIEGGIQIDINLKDVGATLLNLIRHYNVKYVTLFRDVHMEGRSWEMAAMEALLGNTGVYSGTVDAVENGKVFYGPVPGLLQKRKIYNFIQNSESKSYSSLSR